VPPAGWLAELREICDTHGIVFVVDEVQSGIGRTGRMWALEHEEVEADVLLAGKGLASGLPLSAIIARTDLMDWAAGKHGSTFGGNPVACAAALATIGLVERQLAADAARLGDRLVAGLRGLQERHPAVVDVRGRGLMIGVELTDGETAKAVEQASFRRGLITLTCGPSSLRLAPPLVITDAQVDTALALLGDTLSEVSGDDGHGAGA
jgi:4-aminobutyrate aminotransferase